MTRWLKRGLDASEIKVADAKVRETVEGILRQVDDRKDAAIRELSKKFDNWEPKAFRLTPDEIEQAIAKLANATWRISDLRRRRYVTSLRSNARLCLTSRLRHCPVLSSVIVTSP